MQYSFEHDTVGSQFEWRIESFLTAGRGLVVSIHSDGLDPNVTVMVPWRDLQIDIAQLEHRNSRQDPALVTQAS